MAFVKPIPQTGGNINRTEAKGKSLFVILTGPERPSLTFLAVLNFREIIQNNSEITGVLEALVKEKSLPSVSPSEGLPFRGDYILPVNSEDAILSSGNILRLGSCPIPR